MKGKTRALITHGAIWSGDGLNSSRLKSTTLLFDEVTFVGPKMDLKWQSLIEEEGLSPKARSVLIENWSDNSGAPEYQLYEEHNWPWDHGPEVLKAATKTVLSEEYGSEFPASYDGYKYGGYLMSEILYWTRNFPTHCFVGDPRGEEILKSVAFQPVTTAEKPQWWDVSMPDFDHLSWDDVIELRSSPYLKAFREVYAGLSMSGRSSDLRQQYHDALGALADEVKPDVSGVTITQILANIPGMFLNPVAIASGADSIGKEMHREAQYGWVYFVRAVDKAKKAGLTPTAKQ